MKRLNLNNVTLVCVDCADIYGAIDAIEMCKANIDFGAIKLLTTIDSDYEHCIKIENHIDSMEKYNKFIITELTDYVDTEFCLICQWDGFVINPTQWKDDFFKYDYIGAPWEHIDGKVGNGGFSLRSKRLLQLTKTFLGNMPEYSEPEDLTICHTHRRIFELNAIKFAPSDVADVFSKETNREPGDPFGFHNVYEKIVRDFKHQKNYYRNLDEGIKFLWRASRKLDVQQKQEEFSQYFKFVLNTRTNNILEIGSASHGMTFAHCAVFNKVYSIDPYTDSQVEHNKNLCNHYFNNLTKFVADSHLPETRDKIKNLGIKFDIIFIDGDHTAQGSLFDYEMYKEFLTSDGLIVFHDVKETDYHKQLNCYVHETWNNLINKTDETFLVSVIGSRSEKQDLPSKLEQKLSNDIWGNIGILGLRNENKVKPIVTYPDILSNIHLTFDNKIHMTVNVPGRYNIKLKDKQSNTLMYNQFHDLGLCTFWILPFPPQHMVLKTERGAIEVIVSTEDCKEVLFTEFVNFENYPSEYYKEFEDSEQTLFFHIRNTQKDYGEHLDIKSKEQLAKHLFSVIFSAEFNGDFEYYTLSINNPMSVLNPDNNLLSFEDIINTIQQLGFKIDYIDSTSNLANVQKYKEYCEIYEKKEIFNRIMIYDGALKGDFLNIKCRYTPVDKKLTYDEVKTILHKHYDLFESSRQITQPLTDLDTLITHIAGIGDSIMLVDLIMSAKEQGRDIKVGTTLPFKSTFLEEIFEYEGISDHLHLSSEFDPNSPGCYSLYDISVCYQGAHAKTKKIIGLNNPNSIPKLRNIKDNISIKDKVAIHIKCSGREFHSVAMGKPVGDFRKPDFEIFKLFVSINKDKQFVLFSAGEMTQYETEIAALENVTLFHGKPIKDVIDEVKTCEFFLGVNSGIGLIATALGKKCVYYNSMPDVEYMYLPKLKWFTTQKYIDIREFDIEWANATSVYLCANVGNELVKQWNYNNIVHAFEGKIYPYWSDEFLNIAKEYDDSQDFSQGIKFNKGDSF